MLEGLIQIRGDRHSILLVDDPEELVSANVPLHNVAVVLLTHISYSTGRMLDMQRITKAVHEG